MIALSLLTASSRRGYRSHGGERLETQPEREHSAEIPIPCLVAQALEAKDDDTYWGAVWELHRRASREVLDAATALCRAADPARRCLGVDILALPGCSGCSAVLLEMLEQEKDVRVLANVAFTCGHVADDTLIGGLVKLKRHPAARVRQGVAFGLSAFTDAGYRRPIRSLILLSRDECADVRDWATFALAQLIQSNTREIRDALAARLTDVDEGIRAEALWGLAVRRDPRVVEGLIRELQAPDSAEGRMRYLVIEAAAETAEPALYPFLQAIRETTVLSETDLAALEQALERCRHVGASPGMRTPIPPSPRQDG